MKCQSRITYCYEIELPLSLDLIKIRKTYHNLKYKLNRCLDLTVKSAGLVLMIMSLKSKDTIFRKGKKALGNYAPYSCSANHSRDHAICQPTTQVLSPSICNLEKLSISHLLSTSLYIVSCMS